MSEQTAMRIFVQCKTNKMPGSDVEKIPVMASAACRKVWNRDFDENHPHNDRLITYGAWMNPKCYLLIDNGPVDEQYTLIKLRWDGQKLVDDPGPLHRYIQKEFETRYQFNPADRPKANGLTDQELKEVLEPEHFSNVMKSKNEMTVRHQKRMCE